MTLLTGTLVRITEENGRRTAALRVGGALTRVSLEFLPQARVGDVVLAEAGVALSIVEDGASGSSHPQEGTNDVNRS